MNLKSKGHLESQKKASGEKLAARTASLKKRGLDEAAIRRDTVIKKMKADIRKADYRLASITAQEKLNADKVKTKAEKLAAKKTAPEKTPAKAVKDAPAKKGKKEKKKAPPPPSASDLQK